MVNATGEIRALTGLRAFAAWVVVLLHMSFFGVFELIPALDYWIRFFFQFGYLAVDLFFILSGFILAYNYRDQFKSVSVYQWLRFYWLRLARIYPVHLLTLTAMVLLYLVWEIEGHWHSEDIWTALAGNLLLIQSWSIPVEASLNGPAWSISCEWFAYLLFPLLMLIIGRLRLRWLGLGWVMAGILPFALVSMALRNPSSFGTGFILILPEFIAGILLYRIYANGSLARIPWGKVIPVVFAALIVPAILTHLAGYWAFWIAPLLVMLVYALANEKCWIAEWLGTPFFVFWGRVSFSLYMTHYVVLLILTRWLPPMDPVMRDMYGFFSGVGLMLPTDHVSPSWGVGERLLVIFCYLIVTHLIAVLTWLFIETPCRNCMRSIGSESLILWRRMLTTADSG